MKDIFHTSKAPAAIGPYTQAVEMRNTLYVSGQMLIEIETIAMK
jgi:2-iminobutanoate/2-iminopropanoate deaminase